MKLLAYTALIAASKAITFCQFNQDCVGVDGGVYDDGGCCNYWTAVEFAKDGKMGKFTKVWKDQSTMK